MNCFFKTIQITHNNLCRVCESIGGSETISIWSSMAGPPLVPTGCKNVFSEKVNKMCKSWRIKTIIR